MLRTNLATRPFYNERLVHVVLLLLAALAVALVIFNVTRIVVLSRQQSAVADRAGRAEARAGRMRAEADAERRRINARQLEAVATAAREANTIIDSRTFSWSELFNTFEETLPEDLRIVSVTPRLERDGRMMVAMVVVGRRSEDVDAFVGELEASGAFRDLLSHQESVTQEGLLETVLEGQYLRRAAGAAMGGQR